MMSHCQPYSDNYISNAYIRLYYLACENIRFSSLFVAVDFAGYILPNGVNSRCVAFTNLQKKAIVYCNMSCKWICSNGRLKHLYEYHLLTDPHRDRQRNRDSVHSRSGRKRILVKGQLCYTDIN